MPRSLQVGPGTRAPGRFPLALDPDVTIAASRLLGRGREVTEESVDAVGGWVERGPIAVHDFFVGTRAEGGHCENAYRQVSQPHAFLPVATLPTTDHSSKRRILHGSFTIHGVACCS